MKKDELNRERDLFSHREPRPDVFYEHWRNEFVREVDNVHRPPSLRDLFKGIRAADRTSSKVETPNRRPIGYSELSVLALKLLFGRFDSAQAIDTLGRATNGELYIFGGAIRRALFNDKSSGDIDIMAPNGDDRAINALDGLGIPFVLNSQKLRRYRWNSLQIDIFQPREFFGGFSKVEEALSYFDLRINALSLHLHSGQILDPFGIVPRTPITDPGINWPRWREMSSLQVVVLAIRLAKIMYEISDLMISTTDAQCLVTAVLPEIYKCNWATVQQRFPAGKEMFLTFFTRTVLDRVDRRPTEQGRPEERPRDRRWA
jgi:hypothetical protein